MPLYGRDTFPPGFQWDPVKYDTKLQKWRIRFEVARRSLRTRSAMNASIDGWTMVKIASSRLAKRMASFYMSLLRFVARTMRSRISVQRVGYSLGRKEPMPGYGRDLRAMKGPRDDGRGYDRCLDG